MTVSIGGFQDIFRVKSQPAGIGNVTQQDVDNLKYSYEKSPVSNNIHFVCAGLCLVLFMHCVVLFDGSEANTCFNNR